MRLIFTGQGRYPEYDEAYERYKRRSRVGKPVYPKVYRSVIRAYCKVLADRLLETGSADLPCELGTIAAATITRLPQYRGRRFIGFGKRDFITQKFDGTLKAFGIVYLPRRDKCNSLRCLGFVANRELFKKVKAHYLTDECTWSTVEFNNDMI